MRLYKYCSTDRFDVLRGGMIRFTPPIEFNDPFEVLPAVREGIRRDKAAEFFISQLPSQEEAMRASYEEGLRSNPLLTMMAPQYGVDLSFEAMRDSVIQGLPEMLAEYLGLLDAALRVSFPPDMQQRLNKMMGILCLSERPDNLLMWGHYGDCHQGFVLEFDASHPFFDQRKSDEDLIRHICKVQYSKQRPQLTLFDPTEDPAVFAHRIARNFFLTKSLDWEYEQEWRMLMALEHADNREKALFSLPSEAVTRVIMGARMLPEKHDELVKLIHDDARWRHLGIDAATIDMDEFRVNVADR